MKKIILSTSVAAISLLLMAPNVSAISINASEKAQANWELHAKLPKDIKKDIKMAVDTNEAKKNSATMRTITGTVSAVASTTITLTRDNQTYTVDASGAKLVRRFEAAMVIGDIQVNDTLVVWGRVDGTSVKALFIRNNSLQAFKGEFTGEVKSVSTTAGGLLSFIFGTEKRGDQTINVSASTTFKKNGSPAVATDIQVGQTVHVDGVWNRINENVTAKVVNILARLHLIDISGTVTLPVGSATGTPPVVNGKLLITTNGGKIYNADIAHTLVVGKNFTLETASNIKAGDSVKVSAVQMNQDLNVTAYLIKDLSL